MKIVGTIEPINATDLGDPKVAAMGPPLNIN